MKKKFSAPNVRSSSKTAKHLLRGVVTTVLCAGLAFNLAACDEAPKAPSESNTGTTENCPPHTYGDWMIAAKPTCATDGSMTRSCSVCGETEAKTTPKTDEHSYGEWETAIPADCAEAGARSRKCSVCNKEETEIIPQTDEHTPFTIPAFEGTCVEKGCTESVYCEVCEAELVPPTETDYGDHWYFEGECLFCGEKVTESNGLAFTYNEETEGYFVSGIGNCKDNEIFIPSEYEGLPVTGISTKAFSDQNITYVYIPDSVLEIRESAFSQSDKLIEVAGCAGVVRIEESAFAYCTALTYFKASETLEYIGAAAFFGCTSLTEIYLPDVMTTIKAHAFSDCTSLEMIALPLCETYGDYIFRRCKALTEILIPSGMIAFPEKLFDLCESLTDIHFLGTEDEWNALIKGRESEFENITVTCWGDYEPDDEWDENDEPHTHTPSDWITDAEATCKAEGTKHKECTECGELLENGTVEKLTTHREGAKQVEIEKGIFCGNSGTYYATVSCLDCGDIISSKNYELPEKHKMSNGVCEICGLPQSSTKGLSFYLKSDGTYFVTTSSTKAIDENVVIGVYNDITVTKINGGSFCDRNDITSITIADCVTTIGNMAFYNCTSIKNVIIGNGVREIPDETFLGCTSLRSVTLGDNVEKIGYRAFKGCTNLYSVYITGAYDWHLASELGNTTTVYGRWIAKENNSQYFGATYLLKYVAYKWTRK